MDSIWEVMNQVIALRKQEPNKSAVKNMKRGFILIFGKTNTIM